MSLTISSTLYLSLTQAGVAHNAEDFMLNEMVDEARLMSAPSLGGTNDFLARVVQSLVDVDILTAEDLQVYRQFMAQTTEGGRQSRSEK